MPLTDFDGISIYRKGQEPDAADIEKRRQRYHAPYHDALRAEIARVKALHGIALLYDCHSIRSQVPFLFDGALPDFNIGTNNGETCAPVIQKALASKCAQAKDYSYVENGRFKGGWTTRHYGQPETGVHAIQMELAQKNYMRESLPWPYQETSAEKLRAVLKSCLQTLENLILKGDIT